DLGRVEPDADEVLPERQAGAQHRVGRVRAQVAQEAQDQVGGDAVVPGAVGQGGGQPGEHLLELDPVSQVGLRVEEDLGPAYAGRRGPGQVRPGQVVEVLLELEHAQVGVVQAEEGRQAVEAVRGPQLVHVKDRHPGAVPRGQADQQLGLERALDMDVQLGNREHADQSPERMSVSSSSTTWRAASSALAAPPSMPTSRATRSGSSSGWAPSSSATRRPARGSGPSSSSSPSTYSSASSSSSSAPSDALPSGPPSSSSNSRAGSGSSSSSSWSRDSGSSAFLITEDQCSGGATPRSSGSFPGSPGSP